MTLHVQLISMLIMVAGGVYLGFTFETYRRLTRGLRKNPFFKYAMEMVFWLIQTAVLFYVLFQVNEGDLRAYVFLACLLGYSIYAVIFRKSYQYILEGIIHVVKTLFNWVIAAVQALLIQPILWVLRTVYLIIKGIVILIVRILYYPLSLIFRLFMWLLPETFTKKVSQLYASCSIIINKLIISLKKVFKKWR